MLGLLFILFITELLIEYEVENEDEEDD